MSTSIGKLIYETPVQLNAGKYTNRGKGTYHLSPSISPFFMFHHRLGMQESCVKGVMTGIRFWQQSFFLHQATLAAMASPCYPVCERGKRSLFISLPAGIHWLWQLPTASVFLHGRTGLSEAL